MSERHRDLAPGQLRKSAVELPDRIKRLPVDARGYPVPWFVEWIDGVPDFRIMDGRKMGPAVRQGLCWICGNRLGSYMSFNVGPMCAVNKISSEPPSHRECAVFAAQVCPFLTLPKAVRRDAGLPPDAKPGGGHMIARNPGVALVWVTRDYQPIKVDNGVLFKMGDPKEILFFAQGRKATHAEIMESVESGLPLLRDIAAKQGKPAVNQLEYEIRQTMQMLGNLP